MIRAGRGDDPRGEGRRVQSVLRAHDEVRVERARRGRIRRLGVELLEERRSEAQRAIRLDRLEAASQPAERRQGARRERRERAGLLGGRRPGQLLGRAPHRHGGAQGIHRGGRARQLLERGKHRRRDGLGWKCRARMPLAGPQQVGHFGVRATVDELRDRVAAVQQTAVRAVDESDGALGADDAFEAGGVGARVVIGRGRHQGRWYRRSVASARISLRSPGARCARGPHRASRR